MPKDAYWFQHDSNAKDDPKCSMLIEQLGLEGYGIYWVLVETLRDQPDYRYPLSMIPIVARKYNTTAEKVKVVIGNYGLFTVTTDEFFLSQSLCNRMEEWDKRRLQASAAGKMSAQKRLMLNASSTDVQRSFNARSTRREEKRREENNNITPFQQAMTDFEEMRKRIKKPLTDRARSLLLEKLNRLSANEQIQTEILNQSTVNCWQGVFPLKDDVATKESGINMKGYVEC